jgi:UDP-N-acetylmuramyl pentapeptide phosphotransferase/UDP-N-acetylglucosamine-1-phosphate transferase
MVWPMAVAVAVVLPASWLVTWLVLRRLRHDGILDRPNERSSHVVPTPRGGGLAIVATALPAWAAIALAGYTGRAPLAAAAAAGILAAVSFLDDRRGLSPATRLFAQAFCVAIGLVVLPGAGRVFQGWLPPTLDLLASGFLFLWFVNLFNFMDGIDGIASTEAASVGGGIAVVAALHPVEIGLGPGLLGISVAASSLGFLWWNWEPARLFMGDVGSVPLGFVLGWLLLSLAAAGFWAPALILPLYFLTDATWTLLKRLARGAKIWQAHREHFYQRAVQMGRGHAAVVRHVLAADLLLIALAAVATGGAAWLSLGLAVATVGALLTDLSRSARSSAP